MTRAQRRAELVAALPSPMRALLELHLAAGNELLDYEIGRDDREGQVMLVMDYPFRQMPDPLPEGITYYELRDRDPMNFEFQTLDGKWSLSTAKLKPMALERLAPVADRFADDLARVAARQAEEIEPTTTPAEIALPVAAPAPAGRPNPALGDAANRFLLSMPMDFDKWHDGTGYDLAALAKVPATELPTIEAALRSQTPLEWRDIEALAQIDTPTARAAVLAATTHADAKVRREVAHHVPAEAIDPACREARLLEALASDDIFGGLSQAIDEAAEFHPPAVVDVLLRGVLDRPGPTAVLFAALLFYIRGKTDSPFDWDHRPFFLRFEGNSRAERHAAFLELCTMIGLDPASYGLRP